MSAFKSVICIQIKLQAPSAAVEQMINSINSVDLSSALNDLSFKNNL